MDLKENKMLKNKWVTIPLGVIIYFIFMLNLPRFTGWMTIISVIAISVYLFTKNEKFKSYNKIVKSAITITLGFLVLFGAGLTTMPQEGTEKSRLTAEKVKIEKQKEEEEKQKIAKAEADKKLEEEKKQAKEEQLKKEQEEQAKKDAEEKAKAEEEARRKAEEDKKKAEAEIVKSTARQSKSASTSSANNSSSGKEVTTNEPAKGERTVYWVPNGNSYHYNRNCRSLARSKDIREGAASRCNKTDPCNNCVR